MDYTLELIGRTMLELRGEMRAFRKDVEERLDKIGGRLDAVERTLVQHQDEMTVTSAMVMRYASEPIA